MRKKKTTVEILPPSTTSSTGRYATVHYYYDANVDKLRLADKLLLGLLSVSLAFNVFVYLRG